ncbi:MAG: UMP kinase [Candidatus Nanoarchaeia archaeon]
MKNPIIISLGGSIMVPDEVDTAYLKRFKDLILKLSKKHPCILVSGGGKTARRYIKAARKFTKDQEAAHWLGISATHMNAQLLKTILHPHCHKEILANPTKKQIIKKNIAIAAGWKPGCSTDKDAVLLAKTYKAKTILNLSNIDYVYTKDPNKFKSAKRCINLSWKELQNIVGLKFKPGENYPFDPEATKLAMKQKLTLYCLNGRKLNEVKKAIQGKPFKGTLVL